MVKITIKAPRQEEVRSESESEDEEGESSEEDIGHNTNRPGVTENIDDDCDAKHQDTQPINTLLWQVLVLLMIL